MKLIFPKVWFATEELMNNQARFFNFSDRGSLRFESGRLHFRGRKQSLSISKIENIDLISPRLPWISIAYSLVAIFIILGLILSRMPSELVFLILFISLPFLFVLLPLVIFAQKTLIWVEVSFVDNENVLHRAYFLDGSRLYLNILGSLLDDTLTMYKKLRSIQPTAG